MDWIVSSQNSYVTVFVFGDRVFRKVIKVKWGHKVISVLIRRDTREFVFFPACEDYSKKAAICKPGRELSPETEPARPWSWTSSFQNWENKFLLLKLPSLQYFARAAQVD